MERAIHLRVDTSETTARPLFALSPESEKALERAAVVRPFRYGKARTQRLQAVDDIEMHLKIAEYKASLLREELDLKEEELQQSESLALRYLQQLELLAKPIDARRRLQRYSKIGLGVLITILAVYLLTGVVIIAPAFGLVAAIGCVMLWLMAHVYDPFKSPNS